MPQGTGVIINGQLRINKNFLEKFKDIDEANVDIEITVINKPAHYLYKYLRGYLIKDMADEIGDDPEEVYYDMKDRFAKYPVDEWKDIPRRQRQHCDRLIENDQKFYIASAKGMTHEELKEFTAKIENHLAIFLNRAMNPRTAEAAYRFRRLGMMTEREFKREIKKLGGKHGL